MTPDEQIYTGRESSPVGREYHIVRVINVSSAIWEVRLDRQDGQIVVVAASPDAALRWLCVNRTLRQIRAIFFHD